MSVYFVEGADLIKIGVSARPVERLAQMQSGSPVRLRLLAAMPGGAELEKGLHDRFSADRERGEWFRKSDDLLRFIGAARNLFGESHYGEGEEAPTAAQDPPLPDITPAEILRHWGF